MNIPDFSDSELWLIRQTLEERYGEPREIELADAEVRINAEERELTQCPVVVWRDDASDVTFVIFKLGDDGFRPLFFIAAISSTDWRTGILTISPNAWSLYCRRRRITSRNAAHNSKYSTLKEFKPWQRTHFMRNLAALPP